MAERGGNRGRGRSQATDNAQRTPVAVALAAQTRREEISHQRSPRIVASGRGAVAEQILAIAFERGVPVREDSDLAQILSTLEIESEVPVDALAAVAEILSYVYRLNRDWPQEDAGATGPSEMREQ